MARDSEATITRFRQEATAAAGVALRSLVLYGSGAGEEYVPGRSDLNFLLVVGSIDLPLLDRLQARHGGWRKHGIATPLVVDPTFLPTSTDTYPLEILGMMAGYRVLEGEDPLAPLHVENEHVRLQVECEVKSKTLWLRRGYLESNGKHQKLRDSLVGALPAIDAILRGLLFLEDKEWKCSGQALHRAGGALDASAGGTLDEILAARTGHSRPNRPATVDLYVQTLAMLDAWSSRVEGEPSQNHQR